MIILLIIYMIVVLRNKMDKETIKNMMKCSNCDYEWKPRKENPMSCPRCKRRWDYPMLKESEK